MPINRSQFFKTLGLGTDFHLLESSVQKAAPEENKPKVQGSSPFPNLT